MEHRDEGGRRGPDGSPPPGSGAGDPVAPGATLAAILAASADTVFVMDRHGSIRYLNRAEDRVVDLPDTRDETTDQEIMRWIHRDDHEEVLRVYTEAYRAARGARYVVTHRILTADGEWQWVEARIVNQIGREGVDGLVVSARNVSDRVHAERRLRHRLAAEELLALLAPTFVDVRSADLDRALVDALGRIGRFSGAQEAWIMRFTDDGTAWRSHVWPEDERGGDVQDRAPFLLSSLPGLAQLAKNMQPIIVGSVAEMSDAYAAERASLERMGVDAMAAHPMYVDGQLNGLVGISGRDGGLSFSRADVWLLGAIGALFGAAFRRCAVEEELASSEERFRAMIHNATDGVRLLDSDLRTVYVSPAVTAITGYSADELYDPDARLRHVHPDDVSRVLTSRRAALATPGAVVTCAYRARHADGHWIDLEEVMSNLLDEPSVRGVVANMRDITAERQHEAELLYQARRDPLTDLPNRRHLDELIDAALARTRRTGSQLALLYLDLDRFKLVNDSFGHHVGDSLLVDAAERLSAAVRGGDVVARLSGDEFVVLCEPVEDEDEALAVAQRVLDAFRDPFSIGAGTIYSTTSVGVVLAGPELTDRARLLRDADAAMYAAKAAGRNRAALFNGTLVAMARERVEIEAGLRSALAERQMHLRYQPIVSLETGEITGSEALLRWDHPERGEILPDVFLSVAEDTGTIVPIGAWVVDEACRQVAAWDAAGLSDDLDMHVNVSVRQLVEGGIADAVQGALVETGIDPARLCIEITESALLAGDDATSELKAVRACGVRLALDDFGTGHSSLSYLRRLDLDMLKIDRSFVDGVGYDEHDTAIVTAIVRLAESLGLVTVGEGIETMEQRERLAEIGCTQGQGFWCAPPLTPDEMVTLVRTERPASASTDGR